MISLLLNRLSLASHRAMVGCWGGAIAQEKQVKGNKMKTNIWENIDNIKPGRVITFSVPQQHDIFAQEVSFQISWVSKRSDTVLIYFIPNEIALFGDLEVGDFFIHECVELALGKKRIIIDLYKGNGKIYLEHYEFNLNSFLLE